MPPTSAILLVRISDDREGEEKGVNRQIQDGRQHADRHGWVVGPTDTHVIIENDVSAYKRRRVRLPDGTTGLRVIREGFRRGLEMLASGEADGMIGYDLDRVARDPRDLEDLIDVVEQWHVPAVSVTGSLDLSTDAGITMARVMVAIANKSSRDTGRRVARAHEQTALAGGYGGGGLRPYGFARDGMTPLCGEAWVITRMVACLLGEVPPPSGLSRWSLSAIARALDTAGVATVGGGLWTSGSVRTILKGPRIAGLRLYKGEIVAKAQWPAILPRDRWEAVCAVLASNAEPARQGTLKRWLSNVLKCSLCGTMLVSWHGPGKGDQKRKYWCASTERYGGCGKISIVAMDTEREVERQVLDVLSQPHVIERLRWNMERADAATLRAELAEDDQQLRELAGMWARREITLGEYRESRGIIEERTKRSKELLTAASPRLIRRLLADDPRVTWQGLTPEEKREAVLLLCEYITVLPFPKGRRRRFWADRLLPVGGVLGRPTPV